MRKTARADAAGALTPLFAPPGPPGSDAAPVAEPHRDSEKLGLVEVLLGAESYRSILEIGCGTGGLASRLVGRCACYVGVDDRWELLVAARRAVRAGRFVPLTEPFRLPPGRHELVVLSEVLHHLGAEAVAHVARVLHEHAACREIVVISPSDGDATADAAIALDVFLEPLSARFEHREMALRARYRIDALLPRESGT